MNIKRILATVGAVMLGAGLTVIGIGKFLFDEGIVSVREEITEHTRQVLVDGKVEEETHYETKDGLRFTFNVIDEAFISYK